MKKRKIETVEIGRGIAALLVVLFHATEIIKLKKFYGKETFSNLWIFGHSGVDFFFVLSGFVIYLSASKMLNDKKNIVQYIKARFLRIYPPYIIICLVLLPIGIYFFNQKILFWDAFKDFILYPRSDGPFIPVAWSLKHEIFFYLLFSIFFINTFLGWITFIFWSIFIIIFNLFNLKISPETNLIFNLFNIEFLLGIIVGWFYLRKFKFKKILFLLGITIFFLTGIIEWLNISLRDKEYYHLLYGLGSMFAIMGLLEIEKNFRNIDNKFKKLLLTIGAASYSIYLVHFALMLSSIRLIILAPKTIPPEIVFLTLTITSILGGCLYWKYVEMPAINLCKISINKFSKFLRDR